MFKRDKIQDAIFTQDNILNILIYISSFHVIKYTSYRLLKTV